MCTTSSLSILKHIPHPGLSASIAITLIQITTISCIDLGFPGSSDGKESAHKAGDLVSIPRSAGSPAEGHGNPLQYSCLENPHGQRSLAGYSPWSHQESDMTEYLHRLHWSHFFFSFFWRLGFIASI